LQRLTQNFGGSDAYNKKHFLVVFLFLLVFTPVFGGEMLKITVENVASIFASDIPKRRFRC